MNNILKNNFNILFLFIFLTAAASMLYGLDRSPITWGDEVYYCEPARQVSLNNYPSSPIYFNLLDLDKFFFLHPPVYLYTEGIIFKIFGVSQYVLRFSGVVYYLISIILIFFITLKLLPPHIKNPALCACFASFIFAFDKSIHKIMRSGRCDGLGILLTIVTIFLLISNSENKNKLIFFLAGVTSILAVLTHPTLIFLPAALIIFCLIKIIKKEASWEISLPLLIGMSIITIPYIYQVATHFEIWQTQFLGHCSSNAGYKSSLHLLGMHFITVFKYMPFFVLLSLVTVPFWSYRKHGFIFVLVLTMLPLFLIGSHNSYVKFIFPAWFIITVVSLAEMTQQLSNNKLFPILNKFMIIAIIINVSSYPILRSYLLMTHWAERDPKKIDNIIKTYIPSGSKIIGREIVYFSCISHNIGFKYCMPLMHIVHALKEQQGDIFNKALEKYHPEYMVLPFDMNPYLEYKNALNAKYRLLYSVNIPAIEIIRYDFFPIAFKIWKVEYNQN